MEHKTTIVPAGNGWQGRCSCRLVGTITPSHLVAAQWTMEHERLVYRVRQHRSHHTPSLRDQRDYYREMATAANTPEEHRSTWAALAEELDRRMTSDSTEEPTLF